MNIPQLPTDNLYKFIAISGLFCSLSFLLIPEYFKHNITIMDINLKTEMELLACEIEYNGKNISRVAKAIKKSKESNEKINKETVELHMSTIAKNRDNRRLNVKQKGFNNLLEHYKFQLNRLNSIKLVGAIISFIWMLIGFFFWYKLVQRPIDISLRDRSSLKKNYSNKNRITNIAHKRSAWTLRPQKPSVSATGIAMYIKKKHKHFSAKWTPK